jgi:hypothetical protein
MAKQQRTIGAFLKITLPNRKFGYARIVKDASYVIYDLMTDSLMEISELLQREIVFIVAVYDDVVTSGRWEKIGKLPLEELYSR